MIVDNWSYCCGDFELKDAPAQIKEPALETHNTALNFDWWAFGSGSAVGFVLGFLIFWIVWQSFK